MFPVYGAIGQCVSARPNAGECLLNVRGNCGRNPAANTVTHRAGECALCAVENLAVLLRTRAFP